MSKFFAARNSDVSSSEEEEVQEVQQVKAVVQVVTKRKMSESDEEEDQKRVILSEKEKKFGKMNEIHVKLMKKLKLDDWVNVAKEFEELNKLHARSAALILKEG